MAVAYEELKKSYSIDCKGCKATRVLRISGADEQALVAELFVGAVYLAGAGVQLSAAARHPTYDWLNVESISFEPATPELHGETNYDKLDVTITYGCIALEYNFPSSEENPKVIEGALSLDIQGSAEVLTIPGWGVWWEKKNKKGDWDAINPDLNVGMVIPTLHATYTWTGVSNPPFDAMLSLIGCINDRPFGGGPKGTVLYTGYTLKKKFDRDPRLNKKEKWDVTMSMIYKAPQDPADLSVKTWNHYYRGDAEQGEHWQRPITSVDQFDSNPTFVYREADLFALFRAPGVKLANSAGKRKLITG